MEFHIKFFAHSKFSAKQGITMFDSFYPSIAADRSSFYIPHLLVPYSLIPVKQKQLNFLSLISYFLVFWQKN